MATEKFHHKTEAGDIVIPHFKNVPFGVIRKLRSQDEGEQLFGLFEAVADAKTLKVLDKLDMEQVGELYEAWQKASAVTAGESSASTDS